MCHWSELAIVDLKLFNVPWLHIVVDFSTFLTIRVITLDALYDVNTPWRQFVEIRSQVDNAKSMGTQQGQDGLLEMVLCFVSEINSIFLKMKKKIKFCSSNILCILFCWFVKLKKRMNARCQPEEIILRYHYTFLNYTKEFFIRDLWKVTYQGLLVGILS